MLTIHMNAGLCVFLLIFFAITTEQHLNNYFYGEKQCLITPLNIQFWRLPYPPY